MVNHLRLMHLKKFMEAFDGNTEDEQSKFSTVHARIEYYMLEFDKDCAAIQIDGAIFDTLKAKAKLHRNMNSYIATKHEDKPKLKHELSNSVGYLLREETDQAWSKIKGHFKSMMESILSELDDTLPKFGVDKEGEKEKIETIEKYAKDVVEAKAGEESGRAKIHMMSKFVKLFKYDYDSSPRDWKDEELEEAAKDALYTPLKLLAGLAAIHLDNDDADDNIQDILSSALLGSGDQNASNDLDSPYWEKVPSNRTLITPVECKELWIEYLVEAKDAIDETLKDLEISIVALSTLIYIYQFSSLLPTHPLFYLLLQSSLKITEVQTNPSAMTTNANTGDDHAFQLIDWNYNFNILGIKDFERKVKLKEQGLSYAVVAIMGPQSSGKSTLFNYLFGTSFKEMNTYGLRSQTTKGIWLARCADIKPLTIVMDMEGTDGSERGEDTKFENPSALFALAIANVVLINMWCHDIGRSRAANLPLLEIVFQQVMAGFDGKLPKKILMVVVRDYSKSSTPEKILEAQLKDIIQKIWSSIKKPPGRNDIQLSDLFKVQVKFLPNYEERKEEFIKEVGKLKEEFVNSTAPGGLVVDQKYPA
ncbi:hypothetical protein L6164_003047 [Bauhinia variegata]|uniref:Uncharacterized protein n=1 Tax=Bauhinia variegata TaxID=167791 RepID=A0ACB9Q217_BAUVA|nr:hypothetical protein L6164_003047 [Bauhinia variegata]